MRLYLPEYIAEGATQGTVISTHSKHKTPEEMGSTNREIINLFKKYQGTPESKLNAMKTHFGHDESSLARLKQIVDLCEPHIGQGITELDRYFDLVNSTYKEIEQNLNTSLSNVREKAKSHTHVLVTANGGVIVKKYDDRSGFWTRVVGKSEDILVSELDRFYKGIMEDDGVLINKSRVAALDSEGQGSDCFGL